MSTHPENEELEKCKQKFINAACSYFTSTTKIKMNNINMDVIIHLQAAAAAYLIDQTMPGLSKNKKEKKWQMKLLLKAASANSKAMELYNTICMNQLS